MWPSSRRGPARPAGPPPTCVPEDRPTSRVPANFLGRPGVHRLPTAVAGRVMPLPNPCEVRSTACPLPLLLRDTLAHCRSSSATRLPTDAVGSATRLPAAGPFSRLRRGTAGGPSLVPMRRKVRSAIRPGARGVVIRQESPVPLACTRPRDAEGLADGGPAAALTDQRPDLVVHRLLCRISTRHQHLQAFVDLSPCRHGRRRHRTRRLAPDRPCRRRCPQRRCGPAWRHHRRTGSLHVCPVTNLREGRGRRIAPVDDLCAALCAAFARLFLPMAVTSSRSPRGPVCRRTCQRRGCCLERPGVIRARCESSAATRPR